jgi:hypothetical protein
MDLSTIIIALLIFSPLLLWVNWRIYVHRGQVQPDDPNDPNSPVITGPEDAHAQTLIDYYTKRKKK